MFKPPELKFQVAIYVFQSHMRCIVQIVSGLFVMSLGGYLVGMYNASNTYKSVGVNKEHGVNPDSLPKATLSDMLLKQTIEEAVQLCHTLKRKVVTKFMHKVQYEGF